MRQTSDAVRCAAISRGRQLCVQLRALRVRSLEQPFLSLLEREPAIARGLAEWERYDAVHSLLYALSPLYVRAGLLPPNQAFQFLPPLSLRTPRLQALEAHQEQLEEQTPRV